jgi:microcystin-dependent protein
MTPGGGTSTAVDSFHTHVVSVTSLSATANSTGSNAAHSNTQPTIVANYIIYAGI